MDNEDDVDGIIKKYLDFLFCGEFLILGSFSSSWWWWWWSALVFASLISIF
jgi:hypothetical protein